MTAGNIGRAAEPSPTTGSSGGERKGGKGLWIALAALIVLLGGAGSGLLLGWGSVEQPIAFNHKLHVEELGAECTDCHLYALTGERATIPNIEVCADCHEEAQTESVEEARLVASIAAAERIPWKKVYRVPDHVFFSHRRHAGIGGLECGTCHGQVGSLERPVSKPSVRLSMDWCMDCHYELGVSNDCLLCHE